MFAFISKNFYLGNLFKYILEHISKKKFCPGLLCTFSIVVKSSGTTIWATGFIIGGYEEDNNWANFREKVSGGVPSKNLTKLLLSCSP